MLTPSWVSSQETGAGRVYSPTLGWLPLFHRTLLSKPCRCCGWTWSWTRLPLWHWQQSRPLSHCCCGSHMAGTSPWYPEPWWRTSWAMRSTSSPSSSHCYLWVGPPWGTLHCCYRTYRLWLPLVVEGTDDHLGPQFPVRTPRRSPACCLSMRVPHPGITAPEQLRNCPLLLRARGMPHHTLRPSSLTHLSTHPTTISPGDFAGSCGRQRTRPQGREGERRRGREGWNLLASRTLHTAL